MGGLEGPPKPPGRSERLGKAAALLEVETSGDAGLLDAI
jgi:hypothetical protein